jgi:DNA polymerase elongation subunit (family B)
MVELDQDAEHWAEEMGRVGAYCLEDSCLPIELFEETYTWIDLLETSTIVQVTVTEIFSRGQQIRVYNQIYSYAFHMGIVMDQRDGVRQKTAGGNVEDPMVGLMFFILLLDFASLYPSIIRAFNFCYTTLVPPGSKVPDEMCNIMSWSQTDADGNVTHFRHRFIKSQYRKGILPQMCENLTNARAEVNAKRGPHNTPIVNIILNKRQLNLKFTNNSIFGFTGAQKLPCQEIFESITAMGRILIKTTANHVREKHDGQIVYGDTDSIMVNLGLNDPYLADEMNTILSKEISALFPDPLKMEPETVFIVGLFIKKKKYMFIAITRIKLDHPDDKVEEVPFDDDYVIKDYKLYKVTTTANGKTTVKYVGIPSHVDITGRKVIKGMPLLAGGAPDPSALSKKGVMSARRDNVLWGREIFNKVTMNIMFMKSLQQTMDLIDDSIIQLMSRGVPFKNLRETRGVGANYKATSRYPMKIFADELRLAGRPVEPGERIDFVFVKCTDPERNKKQGYKMRTPEMYWENCETEPIDYPYYVQKTANAIEQIFYIGYKKEIDEIELKCQPEIRRRKRIYTYITHTYVKNWVKMLRYKEEMVKFIRERTPHFPCQEPYFTRSFADEEQEGPVIEIIEVPDYAPTTDDYGMSDSESDSE